MFQYRVCDVKYFLDEMSLWEIDEYLSNIKYLDTNNWEQARIISYFIAQVNSSKTLEAKSLLKLPWDDKADELPTEITNDEIERLRKLAKRMEGL